MMEGRLGGVVVRVPACVRHVHVWLGTPGGRDEGERMSERARAGLSDLESPNSGRVSHARARVHASWGPAGPGYLGPSRTRPAFGEGRTGGLLRRHTGGGTYHVGLAASFFIFLICLVAHWLSCLVLVLLERRPCVRRSLMGSTSTMLSMCMPKAVSRSLQERINYQLSI